MRHSKNSLPVRILAATVAVIGALSLESSSAPNHNTLPPSGTAKALGKTATSANIIEAELNSARHVSDPVTVEAGSAIPLPAGIIPAGVATFSPIKINKDTYAYFVPPTDSGQVTIREIHHEGPLDQEPPGDNGPVKQHEVVTPLTVVFDRYYDDVAKSYEQYFFIVQGNTPGDITKLSTTSSGFNNELFAQIDANRVGDVAYTGK